MEVQKILDIHFSVVQSKGSGSWRSAMYLNDLIFFVMIFNDLFDDTILLDKCFYGVEAFKEGSVLQSIRQRCTVLE